MKKAFNLLVAICIFILAHSQQISYTITELDWTSYIDEATSKIRFNFTYETNDEMDKNTEFTLELQEDDYLEKVKARCFIERANTETRRLSASTLNKRKLQMDEEKGYCLLDIPFHSGSYYPLFQIKDASRNVKIEVMEGGLMVNLKGRQTLDICFRQVNSLIKSENENSFNFYGVTPISLNLGYKIFFETKLILNNGSKSVNNITVNCTLIKEAEKNESIYDMQADFKCIFNADEDFESLEIIDSNIVGGFPIDKVLLNPVLTDNAIRQGRLFNCSEENTPKKIYNAAVTKMSQLEQNGKVKINAYFKGQTESGFVTIPLVYPQGVNFICIVPKKTDQNISTINLECLIDGLINNEIPIFGKNLLMDEGKELFVLHEFIQTYELSGFYSTKTLKERAEEKLGKTLTFRQISDSTPRAYSKTEIHFVLYIFNTDGITEERTKDINIKGNLVLGNDSTEENITTIPCRCNLGGENPDLVKECTCNKYNLDPQKNYTSFQITESDDVTGIPENKLLRDAKIHNELLSKDIIYEVGSTLNIISFEKIDGSSCETKGEFKLIGGSLNKDIEFVLPLTYPVGTKAKCKYQKGDDFTTCIMGNSFTGKEIMIEQQAIRSENFSEEYFGIKSIKSDEALNCVKGNATFLPEDEINTILIQVLNSKEIEDIDTSKSQIPTEEEHKINETLSILNDTSYAPNDNKTSTDIVNSSIPIENPKTDIINNRSTDIVNTSIPIENPKTDIVNNKSTNILITTIPIGSLNTDIDYQENTDISIANTIIENLKTDTDNNVSTDIVNISSKIENPKTDIDNKESTDISNTNTIIENLKTDIDNKISTDIINTRIPIDNPKTDILNKVSTDISITNTTNENPKTNIENKVSTDISISNTINVNPKTNIDNKVPTDILNTTIPFDNSKTDIVNNRSTDILPKTIFIDNPKTDIVNNRSSDIVNSSIQNENPKTDIDIKVSTDILHTTIPIDNQKTDIVNKGSTDNLITNAPIDNPKTDIDNKGSTDNSITNAPIDNPKTITNAPIDNPKTDIYINDNTIITKEDALKIAEISTSFRQITNFKYSSGTISFLLYALATQEISKGNTIILSINLIKANGEMEEESKNITCTLENDIKPTNNDSIQANYKCELSGLTESYISLRLNNSKDIVGIPLNDEIALNPVLTDKAIEKGESLNYTDNENQNTDNIPATFTFESIDQTNCKNDGSFTIKGQLSKEITIVNKFNIYLIYPEGISAICSLQGSNIECILDRRIKDNIIIEQTVIKDGPKEVLNLGSISTNEVLDCQNGLEKEAEEKSELHVSFRQVSHLVDNNKNGFSFYFASFISDEIKKGQNIIMKMVLLINNIKTEKNAICVLQNDVSPKSGEKVQGDFNCEVTLENDEYKNINFSDPNAINVSPDNYEISGCSELDKEESSPKATDNAIENSKNENRELAMILDCYSQNNKNIKPPTLEISSITELKKCNSKGKFNIKGKVSVDINEEINFDLPLSYPSSNIKCIIESAKAGEENEFTCKVQKGFKNVNSFIIEPRLIKKKRKELIFITGNKINLDSSYSCDNFNNIKLKQAKARKSSKYTFLQMSRPARIDPSMIFFMSIMKKATESVFSSININIDVVIVKSSRLRHLQETQNLEGLEVKCDINESSDSSCSFGCKPTQTLNGNATKVEINDDSIGGIPDAINVETNPVPDYSLKQNLEKIDELPSINITDITGDNCTNDGKFEIRGIITGDLSESDNITIPLSNPDSSGLCQLKKSNNNEAVINCENAEDFTVSTIMISPQIIYDKYGINPLFKINNDFTSTNQFSCSISYEYIRPNLTSISNSSDSNPTSIPSSSSSSDSDVSYGGNIRNHNKGSDGLSKGAIAAIVICSVVVVAIVAILVVLIKKGMILGKKPPVNETIESSIKDITKNNSITGNNINV